MEKVKASALPRKPERIPIIALFEDEQAKAVKKIGKSIVNAAVTKPFDNKQLMYNATTLLDTPFSIYTFKNINWTQPRMKVHIAKEARLREISEYGATIQYSFPINPGTISYLHEAIYKQAPDENMCCRFYHNEPDPEDKDKQLCSLLYYGINEKFLKEIRSWIRENYAEKKNQNQ